MNTKITKSPISNHSLLTDFNLTGRLPRQRRLTSSSRHLFSLMAPQQPRKPSRNSRLPRATTTYTPVNSSGLAATISLKPIGSSSTQTPTPSRKQPPSWRKREGWGNNAREQLEDATNEGTRQGLQSSSTARMVTLGFQNKRRDKQGTHKNEEVEDEHEVLHTAEAVPLHDSTPDNTEDGRFIKI